jgi:hypothetical protein
MRSVICCGSMTGASRPRPSRTSPSGIPRPDCEINDDLLAEGLPLPDNPPQPGAYGLKTGENAETYYRLLLKPTSGGARTGKATDGRQGACGIGTRLRVWRSRRTAAMGAA